MKTTHPRLISTLSLMLVFASLHGCSNYQADLGEKMKKNTDQLIEQEYIPNFDQKEAIEFLEKGGHFVEMGDPEDQKIDVPAVVPCLERLQEEFGMKWIAFIPKDDPEFAEAIVAKIPLGVSRKQVHETLVEIQQDFPGDILQEWGDRWFLIDFLDEEESQMLTELEAEMDR